MTCRPLAKFAMAAFLLIIVSGCGEPLQAPSTVTPTAAPTATPTAPVATATVAPTPTAVVSPTPRALTTSDGMTYVNLGLPGGDSYSPVAVATDGQLRQVYVYSSYTDQDGEDTLSVLQTGTLKPVGTIRLGGTQRIPSLASQLVTDPASHRVYALNADRHALVVIDGASLNMLYVIQGARRIALAPDAGRLYVLNDRGQVKCLSTADYHELSSIDWDQGFEPELMAYNSANDGLYLGRWSLDDKGNVIVLDGTTLAKKADIALASPPLDLQIDPVANEIYAATNAGIVIIDGVTGKVAQTLNLSIGSFYPVRRLALDRAQRRLFLSFNAGIALESGGGLFAIDLTTRTVLHRAQTKHFWQDIAFEPGDGVLYAATAMNDSLLLVDTQGSVQRRAMLGLRLMDVQVDPETAEVWAVDSGGTVHTLDGQSLREVHRQDNLVGTVTGGLETSSLVLTGSSVYVTDPDQKVTLALDAQTGDVRQRVKASGPLTVDLQGQRLLIADNGIKIFGIGTAKPIGQIDIAAGNPDTEIVGIQFEPVTNRLFVKLRSGVNASLYRTSWKAYDARGRVMVAAFSPEYRDIEGLAVVPEANRVYLTYSGSSDWDKGLAAYDANGAEQERLRGIHGQLLTSPDGQYVFVLTDNAVWMLDREKLEPVALLPLSEPYEKIALNSGGDSLYLSQGARIAMQPVGALLAGGVRSQKNLPQSLGLPPSTYRAPQAGSIATLFAVLPGGGVYRSVDDGQSWTLSSRGLRDLNVADLKFSSNYATDRTLFATTRNATYVSRDGGDTWSKAPAWAPAYAFAYDAGGKPEIYTMNADGSQIRRLGKDGVRGTHPSWSPDNNWITFASNRSGSYNIYVMQVDGFGLARASSGTANDTEPTWSPDGSRIAFTSDRDGHPQIYVMDADGGNPRHLAASAGSDREPAWSPDSAHLAFTSNRSGSDQIYALNLDTGQVQTVTAGPGASYDPAWSADGGWLAFVSDRGGNADIFRARLDGSELARVISAPSDERQPGWSPDGGSLIFASNKSGKFQLYLADLNGGNWRRLRMDPASETQPVWIHR